MHGCTFFAALAVLLVLALGQVESEKRSHSEALLAPGHIEIWANSTRGEDKIQFMLNTRGIMELVFGFQHAGQSPNAAFGFTLQLNALVERTLDRAIVSQVLLSSGSWTFFGFDRSVPNQVSMTHEWNSSTSPLVITTKYQWSDVDFDQVDPATGATVTTHPSQVKWTMTIANYPYEASVFSVLDLEATIVTTHSVTAASTNTNNAGDSGKLSRKMSRKRGPGGNSQHDVSSDGVNIDDNNGRSGVRGVFGWSRNATCTTQNETSNAPVLYFAEFTPGSDTQLHFVFLSDQPSLVVWDPTVGAVSASASGSYSAAAPHALSVLAVAAAALVAVIAV